MGTYVYSSDMEAPPLHFCSAQLRKHRRKGSHYHGERGAFVVQEQPHIGLENQETRCRPALYSADAVHSGRSKCCKGGTLAQSWFSFGVADRARGVRAMVKGYRRRNIRVPGQLAVVVCCASTKTFYTFFESLNLPGHTEKSF